VARASSPIFVRRLRAAGAWVAPSAVAAIAASIAAGAAEAAVYATTLAAMVAAAGYAAIYAVPIALAVSLLARAMWAAWRPRELVDTLRDADGSSPRLAAWLLYLGLAAWALMMSTLHIVSLLLARSGVAAVVALASALILPCVALALLALSRPVVALLARGLARIDAAARARGRALLRPRAVLTAAAVAAALALYATWALVVRPRIGHLELGAAVFAGVGAMTLLGGHLAWRAAPRRGRLAAAAAIALGGASLVAAAVGVRHHSTFALIEAWETAPVGGLAVDLTHDIEGLRSDVHLAGVAPRPRHGAAHPDIVLITIDTFRADRSPPYGGPAAMPSLERLAAAGAVFDWAFAPSNVTRRSLPSIATGLAPPRIRGRVAGWALKLDPRHVMLAERLRAAGYDTAGFFCCRSQFGPEHELGLTRGIDHLVIERDAAPLAREAARWLTTRAANTPDRPVFVWVHFIEPHGWDTRYPASKYGLRLPLRYDRSLVDVDRGLGILLAALLDDTGPPAAIIALTSDHGESLGDHGDRTHSSSLYNAQIRVPLIIAGPGIGPRRVRPPVGLAALAPTLLDLAGFHPPGMPEMDGVSVAALARGEHEPPIDAGEAYAVQMKDRSVAVDLAALIVGRHKLIVRGARGRPELYDLVADPRELTDRARERPERVDAMLERLDRRRAIDAIEAFGARP
jgi:arylsulfatase A-like enzyme